MRQMIGITWNKIEETGHTDRINQPTTDFFNYEYKILATI